jgi:hypothetical protein
VPPKPRLVANDEATTSLMQLVRFDGQPGNVQALVPVPAAQRRSVAVSADLPDGLGAQIRALTAPLSDDWTTVRLLLPAQTPHGEYRGELTWAGGTIPAVVVVRRHARVHATPGDLRVQAFPGEEVKATVALHNAGNVAVDVRRVFVVPLEHINALDRAIIAALTSAQTHLDRFGIAADSLASDQVGLVRLIVVEGEGPIAPGHTQQTVLELRMPETLEPGTTYSGSWLVGGLEVPIVVDAVPAPAGAAASAASTGSAPGRVAAPRKTAKEKS